MKLLKYLEKHCIIRWVAFLGMLAGFYTGIVEPAFTHFGLLYRVKRVRVESVQPSIRLFPGEKIRLSAEFPDGASANIIETVEWLLLKDGKEFRSSGLDPDIVIPAIGGIYSLSVSAKVLGENSPRSGRTSLHIINDKPEVAKMGKDASIRINPNDEKIKSAELKGEGFEIFTEEGWSEATLDSENPAMVKMPADRTVPVFQGRVLYRLKGNTEQLSSYGSATIQQMLPASLPPKKNGANKKP